MRPPLRFVIPLLVVLGVIAWGASIFVDATGRRWEVKDVDLRSLLAANGSREGLVPPWRKGDREQVRRVLAAITRDERIMGTAACGPAFETVASTSDYPTAFGCESLAQIIGDERAEEGEGAKMWSRAFTLRGGPVRVNAVSVWDGKAPLGHLVLVHDMSYAARRETKWRHFTLLVFVMFAIVAALATVLVARFSWRSWTQQVRDFLRGTTPRREFQPILGDVRELVARLAAESSADRPGRAWTAERLQQTLRQHLHGEKVVIVANREPYIHDRGPDGQLRVLHPASGLVTALEPVMRACSGVWVAHGSGTADRETADQDGHIPVPPGEESYTLRRVWLSPEEEKGYYYGFSNEGLWPLCHLAHTRPAFRSEDWAYYQQVNRKFAEAVCSEVDSDDPIILVQDYHFALAPRMIRERLPRATILTFWHTPWPNAERIGICPWHNELLEGLLGSSIVGFHTQQHCNNFLEAIDRFLEARIDREQQAVVQGGRPTLVRGYPISIEWPTRWLESSPSVAECRRAVRAELDLPADILLGVGVDRLDYTKGIPERLLAVERLLEHHPELRGRFTFAQLAAPSRAIIEQYRNLNRDVEVLAARINERFGSGSYRPIALLRQHHEPPTVFRYYRAADFCYVSSLHDGMNLVAKEFVAARDDERGVLVLSQFTGAARELTEALVVNPYDLDQASEAMCTALEMSAGEQAERMRAMRAYLGEFNVYRWAGRMLVDAARLRNADRLTGRLTERLQTTA